MLAFVLESSERYLNAALEKSTAAMDLARSLRGKCLGVRIAGLNLELVLRAEDSRFRLRRGAIESADAAVSGTPLALMSALAATTPAALTELGVTPHGDAELLESFSRVLRLLKPDLEDELSQLTGDVVAHRLFRVAADVEAWLGKALAALTANTSEFLQEESRDVPARQEAERFYREIEELRDDAARLSGRAERIRSGEAAAGDGRCDDSG